MGYSWLLCLLYTYSKHKPNIHKSNKYDFKPIKKPSTRLDYLMVA